MRQALKLFLILILTIQCKNVENIDLQDTDWNQTKTSRHYSDYTKYIQKYPASEHLEDALSEYLFLQDSIPQGLVGCYKDNARISLVDEKRVLFDGELKSLDSLKHYALEYLKSGRPDVSYSLNRVIKIPESNLTDSISTGRFDIGIYNKPYPIKNLKIVLTELSKGINDYKEYLSTNWFGKSYSELSAKKKTEIDKMNDQRLVFFDFSQLDRKFFDPPPPETDYKYEPELYE